jgi:hypothetical protein
MSDINDLLESNNLVINLAFLIFVILFFVIFLKLGFLILEFLFSPNKSPHLFNGMISGSETVIFPQNPLTSNAVTIYRSSNENDGIEFTWSLWLFIEQIDFNISRLHKHIFSKGNQTTKEYGDEKGIVFPNNAPGLYIKPNSNDLLVIMNTFTNIKEEIDIPNIPLNIWVNVMIRCQNTTLDDFINGTITRSIELSGVPKQNYGDVCVGLNGGVDGYISNLWYYDSALGTTAIQNVVNQGPNTTLVNNNTNMIGSFNSNYLSMQWFFNNN